jgi:hypothetical protein
MGTPTGGPNWGHPRAEPKGRSPKGGTNGGTPRGDKKWGYAKGVPKVGSLKEVPPSMVAKRPPRRSLRGDPIGGPHSRHLRGVPQGWSHGGGPPRVVPQVGSGKEAPKGGLTKRVKRGGPTSGFHRRMSREWIPTRGSSNCVMPLGVPQLGFRKVVPQGISHRRGTPKSSPKCRLPVLVCHGGPSAWFPKGVSQFSPSYVPHFVAHVGPMLGHPVCFSHRRPTRRVPQFKFPKGVPKICCPRGGPQFGYLKGVSARWVW